jgi:hypothetical protein
MIADRAPLDPRVSRGPKRFACRSQRIVDIEGISVAPVFGMAKRKDTGTWGPALDVVRQRDAQWVNRAVPILLRELARHEQRSAVVSAKRHAPL